MKTKIFNYFLLSVVVLFLSSCSRTKEMSYQEEVQLSNGEIIVIKRTYDVIFRRDEWFQKKINVNNQRIDIIKTNSIHKLPTWFNEKYSGTFHDRDIPLILDKDENGSWIIVIGTDADCYNNWNSDFPYRQYRIIDNKWQRVKFDKNLFGRNINLDPMGLSDIKSNIESTGKIAPELLKITDKPHSKGYFRNNSIYNKIYSIRELFLMNGFLSCKNENLTEDLVKEQEQWLPDNYIPLAKDRKKNNNGDFITVIKYRENWGDTLAKKWADMPIDEVINKLDEQNKEQSK